MKVSAKTIIVATLAALLGIASALMLNNMDRVVTNKTTVMPISINLNQQISLRKTFDIYLKLTVIRNGQVVDVREDYKDPILKNFYVFVYNYFLGGRAAGRTMRYVDTSGTARTYVDTEYGTANPHYIGVAIGNGTTPVSPTDYKLASWYASSLSPYEMFGDNSTHGWINYTAEFYIDTNINISEAGLFLYSVDAYQFGGETSVSVYITRDIIYPSVQLQVDDYLIVTYVVYIKKSGNFVENFYILLHNYIFRNETYPMLSYNDTSGASYYYVDTEHGGYNPKAHIQLGNGTATYKFATYNLSSPIGMKPANIRYEDNTPDNITVYISALFSFNEDYNISEIGLVLELDADKTATANLVDVLILYMPLATPISVTAGQQLVFMITITLTY